MSTEQKIAIVYDRVNKFGGAERVLLVLHEMFPEAPLYTSVYDPRNALWAKVFPKVYTSFLQKIPFAKNNHQLFGWLMPLIFEQFNFLDYDLVISVTSEAAKGIITSPSTLHVCCCLTPTRYLWSHYDFYFRNKFFKTISLSVIKFLKYWDKIASNRPDKIIAISTEVKKRIKKYYNLDSEIIFPPVNTEVAIVNHSRGGIYYFVHGRFEPYKRLDLIIDVFNENKLPLVISGSGSEFFRLKKYAENNIKFIEKPTDEELSKLYSKAKAFLMPQEEDFGITAVEAQSFGVPVIAYKKGGALDTVVDGKTGVCFEHQTKKSLKEAIAKFDRMKFNSGYLKKHAESFSKEKFKKRLQRSLVRTFNSRWRRN